MCADANMLIERVVRGAVLDSVLGGTRFASVPAVCVHASAGHVEGFWQAADMSSEPPGEMLPPGTLPTNDSTQVCWTTGGRTVNGKPVQLSVPFVAFTV